MPALSRSLGVLFALAAGLALSSCGLSRKMATVAPTEKAPRGLPSDEELGVGEIAFVRGTSKPFVLIRMSQDFPLPEQARLQTRPDGDRSPAVLQLSSERRGNYLTADILSGQPHLGDRVVLPYPTGDATDAPVPIAPDAAPLTELGSPGLEGQADPLSESNPSLAPTMDESLPPPPVQIGERVQIRTTVGDEPTTVYDVEPVPADEIDDALDLPSYSRLPGEEVPFIEPLEDSE